MKLAVPLIAALLGPAAMPDAAAENPPPRVDVAQGAGAGGGSSQDLANQASNPNAPLAQLQARNVIAPRLPGHDGAGNLFQLEAVLPFKPFEFFPFATIMKITVPAAVTVPDPDGGTGFGNVQFFDQAVFKESWGSWGLGVSAVFPTANRPPARDRRETHRNRRPTTSRRKGTKYFRGDE